MCVIAYKPEGINFPSVEILENCFENNPDGAGFMYVHNKKVHIRKGFETFEAFSDALKKARKTTGDKTPYVMHFRIATQGYERCMTHPFPLSDKMSDLKLLSAKTEVGVCHNGIISLTSDGAKEYSDTMKFITNFLSLIITNHSWYKSEKTKQLIERLIQSRLAVLDKNGHCEVLGSGWVEDDGILYSNSSYSYKRGWTNWSYKMYDPYEKSYNLKTGLYDFKEGRCPLFLDEDDSYCYECSHSSKCKYATESLWYANA